MQRVIQGFELSARVCTRLLRVAASRHETLEECIETMLVRGLDLEEVFGPVDLDDDPVRFEPVDDGTEPGGVAEVADDDWAYAIREDV